MDRRICMALVSALLMTGMAEARKEKEISLTFKGKSVTVVNELKDSTEITTDGAHVNLISNYNTPITVRLQGKSEDGNLVVKSNGRVKVVMNNLQLTSQEGAPLWLKNKKRVEISVPKGTKNSLTVIECQDTAQHKAAVIFAKENIKFTGAGQLDAVAEGKGCKGITAKGDITIDDLTLNVTTKGDNWTGNRGKFGGMGGFGGGFPGFGGGEFNPDSIPNFGGDFPGGGGFGGGFPGGGFGSPREGARGPREGARGPREGFRGPREGEEIPDSLRGRRGGRGRGGFGGGFPGFGGGEFNPDSIPNFGGFPGGGFPGFGGGEGMPDFGGFDGGFPGFGGSSGGHGNPKGISAAGNLTINSGNIHVQTAFHGGEGLESKQVLTINGGNIDINVIDDAINCAKQIVINGGKIIARSSNNDAIDCNGQQNPIILNGGEIYAWSSNGSPEEGIDCDFSPIELNGGRIFSMGGGMMGDEPSKPSNETSKQPSYLLTGLEMVEGQLVEVYEGTEEKLGKKIDSFKAPFDLGRCSSLISYPEFKVGGSYVVKVGDKCHTLKLEENFNTNSEGGHGGGFGGFGGFGGW